MTPQNQFLVISNLSKQYSNQTKAALSDFSLIVRKGEIVSALGESGSGKSTLLRILAGFEEADSGSIELNGITLVNSITFIEPEKRKIGLIFQDFALFPHLTVEQNILFGVTEKKNRTQAIEWLRTINLEHCVDRFPHQLSKGQEQRVAIVQVLASQPDIVLLDEPFNNLDKLHREELRERLKHMVKNSGTTTIMVTHDKEDALSISDRMLVLRSGKTQQIDTPHVLYHNPKNTYVAKFLGDINIFSIPTISRDIDDEVSLLECLAIESSTAEQVSLIRAEDIQIKNKGIPVIVKEIYFLGNCHKIMATYQSILYPDIHKNFLICSKITSTINLGNIICITLQKQHFISTIQH